MNRHITLKSFLHSFTNFLRCLQSFDQLFIQILFSLNINCRNWFFYRYWTFWCKLVDLRNAWNTHCKFNCLNGINFNRTFEKVDLTFKFISFILNLAAFKYVACFQKFGLFISNSNDEFLFSFVVYLENDLFSRFCLNLNRIESFISDIDSMLLLLLRSVDTCNTSRCLNYRWKSWFWSCFEHDWPWDRAWSF